MNLKIISGGQTGVDKMALELAKELGIKTGGFTVKGYLTEKGPDLSLKDFNLIEIDSVDFPKRTKLNVKLASGTILFGDLNSRGSKLVKNHCLLHFHPIICNPTSEEITSYIKDLKKISEDETVILNIAGNRASKISKEDLDKYREILKWGIIKSGEKLIVDE